MATAIAISCPTEVVSEFKNGAVLDASEDRLALKPRSGRITYFFKMELLMKYSPCRDLEIELLRFSYVKPSHES
jgi:hypothetical protein